MRAIVVAVAVGVVLALSVSADDNVSMVQEKLRDDGFYSGEIDGAYSTDLSAALSRYQMRNGLPITGQLDTETAKALDAKPAVGPSTAGAEQSSETWRRLRRAERRTTSTNARQSETAATEVREAPSPRSDETPETSTETLSRSAPAATEQSSAETTEGQSLPAATGAISSRSARPASSSLGNESAVSGTEMRPRSAPAAIENKPASAPPAPVASSSGDGDISTDRLRDYVGAFVLAGLDPRAGSEADFFADRVKYYDQGVVDREKIRNDLQDYAARWPERHFWFAGNIIIEPQHRKRVRVTFPLRYELRNGATYSSGRINKTLVLEPVGDDLQIVAVSEEKAE
jgi:hypothetical protein